MNIYNVCTNILSSPFSLHSLHLKKVKVSILDGSDSLQCLLHVCNNVHV